MKGPTIRREVLATMLVVAVTVAPARAWAQGSGQVVGVHVEGLHADEVEGWLEDRVTAPDRLKTSDVFEAALRARGALPLRRGADSPAEDVLVVAHVRAAAIDAGVDRAVLVDVRRMPHGTRVHVWQIDARDDKATVDAEVSLVGAASVIQATRAVLGMTPALAAHAEPAPPPEPSPPPSSGAPILTPSPSSPPSADRVPGAVPAADPGFLRLDAEAGVGSRRFSYVQRITPSLRPYELDAAPLAMASASVFPLDSTRIPVVRDLGIVGSVMGALAVTSQDSGGARVGTTWQSFDVDLAERIAFGRFWLAQIYGGYGGDDFQFTGAPSDSSGATLPSVSYRFVRVGAEVRWTGLSPVAFTAGGSYLGVLDAGSMSQLFPRASVGGVEGHVRVAYRLTRSWQASLEGAYTRMFYSFNPVPGDAEVAGGALDEQARVTAGVSYAM